MFQQIFHEFLHFSRILCRDYFKKSSKCLFRIFSSDSFRKSFRKCYRPFLKNLRLFSKKKSACVFYMKFQKYHNEFFQNMLLGYWKFFSQKFVKWFLQKFDKGFLENSIDNSDEKLKKKIKAKKQQGLLKNSSRTFSINFLKHFIRKLYKNSSEFVQKNLPGIPLENPLEVLSEILWRILIEISHGLLLLEFPHTFNGFK